MNAEKDRNRECPYCKEEVRADAIKCKHCRSPLAAEGPTHGGVCPFCKEAIHVEALKCKHCESWLQAGLGAGPEFTPPSGMPGEIFLQKQCGNCETVGGLGGLSGVGRQSCCRKVWKWNPVTKRLEPAWECWFEPCTPEPVRNPYLTF